MYKVCVGVLVVLLVCVLTNARYAFEEARTVPLAQQPARALGGGRPGRNPEVVNNVHATGEFAVQNSAGNGWVKAPMMAGLNTACFVSYTQFNTTSQDEVGCAVYYDPDDVRERAL